MPTSPRLELLRSTYMPPLALLEQLCTQHPPKRLHCRRHKASLVSFSATAHPSASQAYTRALPGEYAGALSAEGAGALRLAHPPASKRASGGRMARIREMQGDAG